MFWFVLVFIILFMISKTETKIIVIGSVIALLILDAIIGTENIVYIIYILSFLTLLYLIKEIYNHFSNKNNKKKIQTNDVNIIVENNVLEKDNQNDLFDYLNCSSDYKTTQEQLKVNNQDLYICKETFNDQEYDLKKAFRVSIEEAQNIKCLNDLKLTLCNKVKEDNEQYNLLKGFHYVVIQSSTDIFDVSYYGQGTAVHVSNQTLEAIKSKSDNNGIQFGFVNEVLYVDAPVQLDSLILQKSSDYAYDLSLGFINLSSLDINSIDLKLIAIDSYGQKIGTYDYTFTYDCNESSRHMNFHIKNNYYKDYDVSNIVCEIISVKTKNQIFEYKDYDHILIDRHTNIVNILDLNQIQTLQNKNYSVVPNNLNELKCMPNIYGKYVTDFYGSIYLSNERKDLVEVVNYIQKSLIENTNKSLKKRLSNKTKKYVQLTVKALLVIIIVFIGCTNLQARYYYHRAQTLIDLELYDEAYYQLAHLRKIKEKYKVVYYSYDEINSLIQMTLDKDKEQDEEERILSSLKGSPPHVGLNEKYIDKTMYGSPSSDIRHDTEIIDGIEYTTNIYDFIENDEVVLTVRCANNEVIEVIDYTKSTSTSTSINQKENSSKKSQSSSQSRYSNQSKSTSNKDRYNVYDYDNPEDFYEDNYDDFDGYDDAETYWEKARDE